MPSKFTDAQREVIACAVLDDNHTVEEALEGAARGDFGLAPFTMSRAVACAVVEEERQRRRPVDEIVEELCRRLLRLCERSVAHLERANQPLGVDDARRAVEAAKLLRDACTLVAPPIDEQPQDEAA